VCCVVIQFSSIQFSSIQFNDECTKMGLLVRSVTMREFTIYESRWDGMGWLDLLPVVSMRCVTVVHNIIYESSRALEQLERCEACRIMLPTHYEREPPRSSL
jgi:hypothetical protein